MQLQERYGTTILMTTHLMEEADQLCHTVAIMHRGKIVANGPPDELKAAIGGRRTTLEDVFVHYTGDVLQDMGESYRETSRTRRTARRLG